MYLEKIEQIKLIAHSELTPEQKEASIKALLDTIPMNCIDADMDPLARKILYEVCAHLQLTVKYVRSRGGQWPKVYARQLYCYVAEKKTSLTKSTIASPFEMNRAIVYKYNKTINDFLSHDEKVKADVKYLLSVTY